MIFLTLKYRKSVRLCTVFYYAVILIMAFEKVNTWVSSILFQRQYLQWPVQKVLKEGLLSFQ